MFSERHFPCREAPGVHVVHTMRHVQLFPFRDARNGLQRLQCRHGVSRPTHGHRDVIRPHPNSHFTQRSQLYVFSRHV